MNRQEAAVKFAAAYRDYQNECSRVPRDDLALTAAQALKTRAFLAYIEADNAALDAREKGEVVVAESAKVTHVGPQRFRVADSNIIFVSEAAGAFCNERVQVILRRVEGS